MTPFRFEHAKKFILPTLIMVMTNQMAFAGNGDKFADFITKEFPSCPTDISSVEQNRLQIQESNAIVSQALGAEKNAVKLAKLKSKEIYDLAMAECKVKGAESCTTEVLKDAIETVLKNNSNQLSLMKATIKARWSYQTEELGMAKAMTFVIAPIIGAMFGAGSYLMSRDATLANFLTPFLGFSAFGTLVASVASISHVSQTGNLFRRIKGTPLTNEELTRPNIFGDSIVGLSEEDFKKSADLLLARINESRKIGEKLNDLDLTKLTDDQTADLLSDFFLNHTVTNGGAKLDLNAGDSNFMPEEYYVAFQNAIVGDRKALDLLPVLNKTVERIKDKVPYLVDDQILSDARDTIKEFLKLKKPKAAKQGGSDGGGLSAGSVVLGVAVLDALSSD